jgi:hypothetical protein
VAESGKKIVVQDRRLVPDLFGEEIVDSVKVSTRF